MSEYTRLEKKICDLKAEIVRCRQQMEEGRERLDSFKKQQLALEACLGDALVLGDKQKIFALEKQISEQQKFVAGDNLRLPALDRHMEKLKNELANSVERLNNIFGKNCVKFLLKEIDAYEASKDRLKGVLVRFACALEHLDNISRREVLFDALGPAANYVFNISLPSIKNFDRGSADSQAGNDYGKSELNDIFSEIVRL